MTVPRWGLKQWWQYQYLGGVWSSVVAAYQWHVSGWGSVIRHYWILTSSDRQELEFKLPTMCVVCYCWSKWHGLSMNSKIGHDTNCSVKQWSSLVTYMSGHYIHCSASFSNFTCTIILWKTNPFTVLHSWQLLLYAICSNIHIISD
jgi:hypothetical protein